MRVIAIIPARGGSKGVPQKNIKNVGGKPLIHYTLEAALKSRKINDIVISSDDKKIIEIAEKHPSVRIHRRSRKLATDNSPVSETVKAVLNASENSFDAIMILQPTSPIRTGEQIDSAIDLFKKNPEANSLISVVPVNDVHPARMYWKERNALSPILPEYEEKRRQDIPTAWYRNGSIYMVRVVPFLATNEIMVKPSVGFPMPAAQLLNIDEPRDILIAEVLIQEWQKGKLL